MLALAVSLADYPLDRAGRVGEARSPACGSKMTISLQLDSDERVERVGMLVSACAVGQAAAAILAAGARGHRRSDLLAARGAIADWLGSAAAPAPGWPGFDMLVPARSYTGRHGVILMPWNAALAALSNNDSEG